jgi:hypothetical protein
MDYEYEGNWKINAVGCGAANELQWSHMEKCLRSNCFLITDTNTRYVHSSSSPPQKHKLHTKTKPEKANVPQKNTIKSTKLK